MRRSIPDLRNDHEITLEHCYLLLERLAETFDILEATDGAYKEVVEKMDPGVLKEFYEENFEPYAFSRLFQSQFGKGVLVGLFTKHLLDLSNRRTNETY